MTVSPQYRNTYATSDTKRAVVKGPKCRDCGKPVLPKRARCDTCYLENKAKRLAEKYRERVQQALEDEARVIGDALGLSFAVRRLSLIRAVMAARKFRAGKTAKPYTQVE